MSAFTVDMANRPGELARLCGVLADRGVNLVVCGVAHGDSGTVAFIADDEDVVREALQDAEIDYAERNAITVRLENVPGAGAAVFQALLEANVNIDVFLPVDRRRPVLRGDLPGQHPGGAGGTRRPGRLRLIVAVRAWPAV